MKEDGTEERLDVYIEYSNPMITLQPTKSGSSENEFIVTDPADVNTWDDAYLGLFGGNAVTTGTKKAAGGGFDERYGLQIVARPYIMDKAKNIINAKVYFPMIDLDVNRPDTAIYSGFSGFYQGNSLLENHDKTLRRYSEGAQVKDGLVINSNGDMLYIPGADGEYKALVAYDENTGYRITGNKDDADPGTFNSGFLALIQNGQFKVSVTQASGTNNGSVITYVMAGSEYNYRLRHSTETLKPDGTPEADGTIGGTIQTTREGNHNGELNDGQIIDPSMIATAVGQTIVYTFTPQPGYALSAVYVWNDDDPSNPNLPIIPDMKTSNYQVSEGDGSNNTYEAHDDNNDGIIDRYTYSFTGIRCDNAIHVVWVRTALDITKSVTGSGAENDTFTFTIKAWGDPEQDGTVEYVDFANDPNIGELKSRFTSLGSGLYQFPLKNGETISVPPGVIPFDYEYEIEEIQVGGNYGTLDGWTPVGTTNRNGKITETNSFAKENFTNNRTMALNPDETLTVKKVWENDASSIRPKYVDMYIQSTPPSAFNLGTISSGQSNNFTSQVIRLFVDQADMRSNMTAFKYGTKAQADVAA